ncbi:AI-2E family transporter [Carnobacteriaceae bacterium zg-C25]|nr:AI-2E family transporter [Carnobacteriaceae bacterium zg-ZUI240]QTU82844.1 AI-2E family transporter [Carnobacteriaceae bacterium zg-C25]
MEHQNKKTTPFIEFLGGINLLFGLVALVLLSISLYLLSTISYIFSPIAVVMASIGTPLILAIVFYYMFVPLVDKLESFKVSRSLGASLSLLILLSIALLLIGIAIPTIVEQVVAFAQALPTMINNFSEVLQRISSTYEFQSYYNQIIEFVSNSLSDIVNQFLSTLGSTIQGLSAILSAVSSVVIALLTFPIFLFFLLIDGRRFKNTFLKLFPHHNRSELNTVFRKINQQVGGYIKGRLLTSFLIGVYFFIAFSICGLNYAFVLAFLSGLLSLIPYIGALIALIPALIVAITQSTLITIGVLIVWAIGQVLDGNILGPLIIGKNLNMHPLTIIIVLLAAGTTMGIVGMIIGIPIYAIMRIFVEFVFNKFKKRYNHYFGSSKSAYDD